MNLKRVSSDRKNKDEILSYLDQIPSELKQDILNQCVNYMIHFSGNTAVDAATKTSEQLAESRQEFDQKTQESLDRLTRLLYPYTEQQLSEFIQELEGKTDPYAQPDEVFQQPKELSELVDEAEQLYQQRQAIIIEELGNNFDK